MLEIGQIWEPEKENEPGRKIVGLEDHIDLVTWSPLRRLGPGRAHSFKECRVRSFEAWVKRTKAELVE